MTHKIKELLEAVIIGAIISAILLTTWARDEEARNDSPPPASLIDALPDTSPESSDGRYHQCGLVTEHGVTEYLAVYADRCPEDGYDAFRKDRYENETHQTPSIQEGN